MENQKTAAENIQKKLNQPIVLIGMMGVGKTKIGHLISRALNIPFFDSDYEIEKAAGMNIADIFEKFGEPHFRDGEKRVLLRLLEKRASQEPACVISTGGGAIMTQEIADVVFSETLSLWIKADLDIMVERTSDDKTRPLLQVDDHRKKLQELCELRYPVYSKADIIVESHNGAVGHILQKALDDIDEALS